MDLSVGSLVASFVVGTAGFGLFLYGKKQLRIPQLVAGIVLMGFPYFVDGALWIYGIAGAVLAGLALAVRAGW